MARRKPHGPASLRSQFFTFRRSILSAKVEYMAEADPLVEDSEPQQVVIAVDLTIPGTQARMKAITLAQETKDNEGWLRALTSECLSAAVIWPKGEEPMSAVEWGPILDAIAIHNHNNGVRLQAADIYGDLGLKALAVCGFGVVSETLDEGKKMIEDKIDKALESEATPLEAAAGEVPT